jgi:hypothetical protein
MHKDFSMGPYRDNFKKMLSDLFISVNQVMIFNTPSELPEKEFIDLTICVAAYLVEMIVSASVSTADEISQNSLRMDEIFRARENFISCFKEVCIDRDTYREGLKNNNFN